MAPTEIIYRIATAYIFGFNKDMSIKDDHFVKGDALKCAQDGTLQDKIDELFGCDNEEKTTDVNG